MKFEPELSDQISFDWIEFELIWFWSDSDWSELIWSVSKIFWTEFELQIRYIWSDLIWQIRFKSDPIRSVFFRSTSYAWNVLPAEFSRSVLDSDPEYCLNKIIYCPITMHVSVYDINLAHFQFSLKYIWCNSWYFTNHLWNYACVMK